MYFPVFFWIYQKDPLHSAQNLLLMKVKKLWKIQETHQQRLELLLLSPKLPSGGFSNNAAEQVFHQFQIESI